MVAHDEPHPARQHEQPLIPLVALSRGVLLLAGTMIFHAWTPPGCRVSGSTVRPLRLLAFRRTRGSPTSGAPTRSSNGTRYANASGSSSSRLARRCPVSSRDRVLLEMPVVSDRAVKVMPRWRAQLLQSRADLVQSLRDDGLVVVHTAILARLPGNSNERCLGRGVGVTVAT